MKYKHLRFALLSMLMMLCGNVFAEFKDFEVIVNNQTGTVLTSNEQAQGTSVEFGVAVASDGTVSRVAASDASSVATISGIFHSDHGLTGMKVVVPVEGNVSILVGQCTYSGNEIKVTNSAGETVASKTPATACWKNDHNNVTELTYAGEATTLTISGMGYCPFIAVKALNEVIKKYAISYSLGSETAQGTLPTGGEIVDGESITIPANFTLYKEGYTLTGWTDGSKTYTAGETVTPKGDLALTPVFTANTVNLADRTAEVTLKWDFQRKNGAPTIQWQNVAGLVWVAQAEVNGKTIDVALPFSTKPGKFNNTSWNDWCQLNQGTTFQVPSCKGATISIEAFNALGEGDGKTYLTIDGQSDYTTGKTVSYTIASSAEAVDVVIGNEGSYYRYIQVVLPVVESAGGESFNNADGLIEWPFESHETINTYTATPESAISLASFEILGDLSQSSKVSNPLGTGTRSADPDNGMKFLTFTGESNMKLHWFVKPAAGVTFTPTQVKMYIQRFGTNKQDGVTISAAAGENGTETPLGTFTARRANWTDAQEESQWGKKLDNLVNEAVINLTEAQQQAFASGEGFHLYAVTGLGNEKAGGFADIRIYGKFDGTAEAVEMCALTATAAEGGNVTKYPNADEYEKGSEVQLTATPEFGYHFVNWTDANGAEVSTEAKFKYAVDAAAVLTANFQKVNTYELKYTVEGSNDYMVQPSPAPTMVDGKKMYEEGTTVTLTASSYENLVTFNNWSDGQTSSEITLTMTEDKDITAVYSEADIIAGWDFFTSGGNGRVADFASEENTAAALSLVNTESGETSGWLDKSTEAAGGYESMKGAAVNWRQGSAEGDVGNWHWQTKVNAEAYSNINVQFDMLYNFNAYQTYNVEYSLDGENWEWVGSITMMGSKAVASFNETLPEEASNQPELYIRMIADKSSDVDGSSSKNDGNALAMFFITGTPQLVDDGIAPELVSSVPADGATDVSASGKVVLTFDEKVKVDDAVTATLGDLELTPVVSGKTVSFSYKGLDYGTDYTFTLPASSVSDLTDNAVAEDITISFTTMERPTVAKDYYDFVVPDDGTLKEAIDAANSRDDKSTRYRIFVKKGEYKLPTGANKHYKHTNNDGYVYWEGDLPDPITYVTAANISLIGEDRDATIVTQDISNDDDMLFQGQYGPTHKYEEIKNSAVLQLEGSATGIYFQDITIKSGINDALGRNLAVYDKSSKNIYKNTLLYGYQDTWTSDNNQGLYYFEDGQVRGRTDYLCGKGDAYFNGVELLQVAGGYAAVPSTPANVGWVFYGCTISESGSGVNGNYTLGRPWGQGTPVAVFIDTKMNVLPSAIGWNEMSNGWPKRFAEYNSMTASGSAVDLSGRKKTFGAGHENNPVLTAEEAADYSDMSKMFGDWQPTLATEQAPLVENPQLEGNTLSWTGSEYALLYAICKDGDVVGFTTDESFDISTLESAGAKPMKADDSSEAKWSVRAANEMGGLCEAVEASVETGIHEVGTAQGKAMNTRYYNAQGIEVDSQFKGVVIKVQTLENGQKTASKVLK
ncbi:MAG: Ig-like domain-containing protein [Prevotella sp.]|nr:Ig-like domain-containing protein [Prevotella sp.]